MKYRIKRNLLLVLFALIFLAGSFGMGYFSGRGSIICEVCPPQDLDFSLFWETLKKLQESFVEPEKIDNETILYGAISGMVDALGDPYTVFFNPEDTERFYEDIAGRFDGVGMEIAIRNNVLKVVAPLEGTPADKAGLRPGDQIIKINGELTSDLSLDDAVSRIRGPKGTKVVLTIFRESWDVPKDIELTRAEIRVPSLKIEIMENNIAYIRIYQFSSEAGIDFSRIAVQVLTKGAEKIILDLRNNPGGYLNIARDISGFFLKRGDLVVIEDFGDSQEEYRAAGTGIFSDYPLVVLINEGSASGAEILAGALRDNREVKLIGETSFGKGSVQQLETLTGGSSVKITIAKWLTPKGQTIEDIGLEPDIEIEITDEDFEKDQDPQLDKAIEIIKSL